MFPMTQMNPFGSMNSININISFSPMQSMNPMGSMMPTMGGFGMDQSMFSPEAMMNAGASSFMHPLMAMNNGFGTPQMGMTNGMGMVPGMGNTQGLQNQQGQQMMQMMAMMMMMMMMVQAMGNQGAMNQAGMNPMQQMGMPGAVGVPGGFGSPLGMAAPGAGGMGYGAPAYANAANGFGGPVGMAPGMMNNAAPAMGGGAMPLDPGTYNVTSNFGPRGAVGGLAPGFHNGIDLAAPQGTPIKAAQNGVVTKVGSNDGTGYGNWVEVTHANGSKSRYAHMAGFNCQQGQQVQAGQVIGFVGSTGNSTGPHLHFETIDPQGRNVDPRTQRTF